MEGASCAPQQSPGLRAREAGEADSCLACSWWPSSVEGRVRTGHSGLPGHTCGDRWGLQDNPSPDTRGSVLWGPPSTSLAVRCGNCPTNPSRPRNLDTMWVTITGGSCLSPKVLALPLLLPRPPPEASSCSGAAAWTPAAGQPCHTDDPAVQRGQSLRLCHLPAACLASSPASARGCEG